MRLALSRFRGAPIAVFWLLIAAILAVPVLLFLAVAFSPRLFDQGPEWFTLSGFGQAFSGPLLQGVARLRLRRRVQRGRRGGDRFRGGLAGQFAPTSPDGGCGPGSCSRCCWRRRTWSRSGWERLLEPMGVLDVAGLHPGRISHPASTVPSG